MGILKNIFTKAKLGSSDLDGNFLGDIHAFQIVYDESSRLSRDPGFEPLENYDSERADWFEYWPIKKYLNSHLLDDAAVYGFLSPRFFEKTGLSSADVMHFIESSPDADVYIFSPWPCHGAFFLNVFEHHDYFSNGSLVVANHAWQRMGLMHELENTLNHSGNVIFSNYFFAKPRFWREWLRVSARLFQIAEDDAPGTPLRQELEYIKDDGTRSTVEQKVFLMERIASFILATDKSFRTCNYPTDKLPLSAMGQLEEGYVMAMDAMKKEMEVSPSEALFAKFRALQQKVIAKYQTLKTPLSSHATPMTYYNNVNMSLFRHVSDKAQHICEFGCGAGGLARAVRNMLPRVHYVGVELMEEELNKAKDVLSVAVCCDLNDKSVWATNAPLSKAMSDVAFDHIIFGDVLEHLYDPEFALQSAAQFLTPGGSALLCIPNVQHWSVFANLVIGTWPREESGIFDRTHIRWFTLDDMITLAEKAGLHVELVEPRIFDDSRAQSVMEDLEPLARVFNVDPDQLIERGKALQYVLLARKPH